jgi:hypothetical protein
MATVTLDQAWFHDAADPSVFVKADLTAATEQAERVGDVRRRAGGRIVVITGPGRPGNLSVELAQCDRTVVNTLRGWVGSRLLYRDPRGRVEFVTFLAISVSELAINDDIADVTVTLQKLTGSVAV